METCSRFRRVRCEAATLAQVRRSSGRCQTCGACRALPSCSRTTAVFASSSSQASQVVLGVRNPRHGRRGAFEGRDRLFDAPGAVLSRGHVQAERRSIYPGANQSRCPTVRESEEEVLRGWASPGVGSRGAAQEQASWPNRPLGIVSPQAPANYCGITLQTSLTRRRFSSSRPLLCPCHLNAFEVRTPMGSAGRKRCTRGVKRTPGNA